MKSHRWILILSIVLSIATLLLPLCCPYTDLAISGLFYEAGHGFVYADNPLLILLHNIAVDGSRVMGVGFLMAAIIAFVKKAPLLGVNGKGWIFLLLALLIGPGLVANVCFKDHWGRARPREITEFGGNSSFSPPLSPQPVVRKNGSFVAGDGAFGFFLPSFAYVVPRRQSRRFFWGGIGGGFLFGVMRIIMGAHFFSDVVFAALFMLLTSAALHIALYGRRNTYVFWCDWFFIG